MGITALAALEFEAVIFDLDGTLIDSTPAVLRSWTIWGQEMGLTAEDLAGFHGVPAAGIVNLVLAPERRAAALERINFLELNDLEGVVPLPGAVQALQGIPADRVAIATSCTRLLADARIGAAELVAPKVLITVDDVQRGKPAPDPFLAAAERLGFDPARCLVVEDAPKGLEAARAAGCHTLAVTTTTPAAELEADAVVANLGSVQWLPTNSGVAVRLA